MCNLFLIFWVSFNILPMEWSNRPEESWKQVMVEELKQYQNLDMQEIFNNPKLFLQCCSWNQVSSTYTETGNKCCKIMVIVQVFYIKPTPLSSLNPFMVSVFMILNIPLKTDKKNKRGCGSSSMYFYPSKILIKNKEMCKECWVTVSHIPFCEEKPLQNASKKWSKPLPNCWSVHTCSLICAKPVWGQQGYNS